MATSDSADGSSDAAKAIDAKANTGWSSSEELVAQPHTAFFLASEPMKIAQAAELHVTLRYDGAKTNRAIGRFRISAALSVEVAQYLNPPKLDPWQVIGAFKSQDLKSGLAQVYEAEVKVDL